jgi:hypothetical protein
MCRSGSSAWKAEHRIIRVANAIPRGDTTPDSGRRATRAVFRHDKPSADFAGFLLRCDYVPAMFGIEVLPADARAADKPSFLDAAVRHSGERLCIRSG